MSIEHAVRKVSEEIGIESVPMAEEMACWRRKCPISPNGGPRSKISRRARGSIRSRALTTVLAQAERYGTPLGAALRVLAQESRDQRMTAAEKKAAALPPTLTVPMILFFLPGLFAAILSPAVIQINHWN